MNDVELFDALRRCTPAQLDMLEPFLNLNANFLPGPGAPPVSRASAMLGLLKQRPEGLELLEGQLRIHFPELLGSTAPITPAAPPAASTRRGPCDILILSANPRGTERLQLEQEETIIRQCLGEGPQGPRLKVHSEFSVSAGDLSKHLLEYDPVILHISAHGSPAGEIILETAGGGLETVAPEMLANSLAVTAGRLECTVLNCCWSLQLADALLRSVKVVIGMSRAIDDESAQKFSEGFYRALGHARSYRAAFDVGRQQIAIEQLPDSEVPHFNTRRPEFQDIEFAKPRITRSAVVLQQNASDFPLWYGTNRKPVDSSDISKGFGPERDRQMHCGTCRVAVPKSHKIGDTTPSRWKRLVTALLLRPDESMRITTMAKYAPQRFWEQIRNTLKEESEAGKRQALVYVHGYHVGFEEAAIRAAQIGMDLEFPGITAFYSWPSQGRLAGYVHDEASIDASEPFLHDFLVGFLRETEVERLHVVGHSMGNRALLRVIPSIATAIGGKPFGQLIFAAPDVDTDVFTSLGRHCVDVAERTTLYVSAKDRALMSSGILHNFGRAGFTPPVTVIPGMDTIDARGVDLTLLGHGFYAEARPCLTDIHSLLVHNHPPTKRFGLRQQMAPDGGNYWMIAP